MTEQPKLDTTPVTEPKRDSSGVPFTRIIWIVAGVMIGVVVLVVVIAVLLARGSVDQAAPIIQIIRDVFIIFLALQGILIIIALAVLIAQIARLINLLQSEVKPILENTQDTVKSASGTVRFVTQNITSPMVKLGGFLAGVSVIVNELGGIRRALRRDPSADTPPANKKSE
jgi:hypothetical protein